MARIPGAEGFGERVARPQRLNEAQVPRAAFGAGLAHTLGEIGADMQRRQDAEALAAAREREAADKAQALSALQRGQVELAALADEVSEGVATGQIDKTQAEQVWSQRARERLATIVEAVPSPHVATVRDDLDLRATTLARTAIGRAVRQRDRDDTRAGIVQTLEAAQRLYRTDPQAADQMAANVLEQLGPFAGMGGDDIARQRQAWRENAQYTRAFEAVSAGRNSREGLSAAERLIAESPDLDPQRRAVLSDRVAAYRLNLDQRDEMAAARRAREAEAALRRAEAAFNSASTLADKGVLNPAYAEQVLGQLAGTPYQQAFRALLDAQRTTGPLAAQPIAQQQATLDTINAQIARSGLTPQLERQRTQAEKVLQASLADVDRDPLRAGLERQIIPEIAPVDLSSPQALVGSVAQRLVQSQVISAWAGRPVSPLTQQEAAQVKGMLDALPVKERSQAVAALAQALGPQAAAGLARQMDSKDRALALAFGLGSTYTDQGRYASELVLRGAQAMKDGTSTKNERRASVSPQQWERVAAVELEGVLPTPVMADAVREAAVLITHGLASERGGEVSEKTIRAAVRLALGGDIVEHNGRRIPLPAGVTSDQLRRRLAAVTPQQLASQAPDGTVRAAGVEVPLADFARSLPAAELVWAGPGRYSVLVQGRPVTNTDGQRIVIGVQ